MAPQDQWSNQAGMVSGLRRTRGRTAGATWAARAARHHLLLLHLLHLLLHRANLRFRAEVEQRDGEMQRAVRRNRPGGAVAIAELRRHAALVLAALFHAGQPFGKAGNDRPALPRPLFVW